MWFDSDEHVTSWPVGYGCMVCDLVCVWLLVSIMSRVIS